MNVNIRQMKYVLAVAEMRSFSKAAKQLYVAQPTLSAHILRIEEEIGTPIFDRKSTPLRLTHAGECFVNQISKIVDINDQLEREMRDLIEGQKGRIKVGLSIDRHPYILPDLLSAYSKEFPNVEIDAKDLFSYEIKESVLTRKLDFGVIPDCGDLKSELGSEIVSEELCSEELVLVGNKNFVTEEHLVSGMNNTVDAKKLQDIPMIMLSDESYYRKIVDVLYAQNNMKPNIAMQTSCNISAYRLATAGFGATIVPMMDVKLLRAIEETPYYSITPSKFRWKLMVIYHKNLYMGEPEKAFVKILRSVLSAKS